MNLLLFLVVLPILGSYATDWKHLYLKFDFLLNGYFSIPLTMDELLEDSHWVFMATDSELNIDFYSYDDDPRVSIGFDTHKNIAGVRACVYEHSEKGHHKVTLFASSSQECESSQSKFVIKDLTIKSDKNGLAFPYSFDDKPLFSKATYWDNEVYCSTILFASPETLVQGGRENTNELLAENIYVKIDGNYTVMPINETDAPAMGFTKQACYTGMGQHYFLNLTSTLKCEDNPAVFLMYDSEELIGMGLNPFGSFSSSERTWFEEGSSDFVKMIAPNSPDCWSEWVDNYGLITFHLFFKEHPRLTFCF